LYGGCSAGGRGAAMNVDLVYEKITLLIPSTNISRFGAMFDSNLWIDIQPIN
jgi:hypothetical protein